MSFMTFVKFTSSVPSLISLLLGLVLSENGTCSLVYTHKLALHSFCSCSQCGMCSGCCCLCVLSSAGVSACCLRVFDLAGYCSETSYPRWVCKATTKQVLPQSPAVLFGDICMILSANLSRNNWEGRGRFSWICYVLKSKRTRTSKTVNTPPLHYTTQHTHTY